MTGRIFDSIRANPDVAAIALLVALALPDYGFARPHNALLYASDSAAQRSLTILEQRGQRVWQRLDQQMRRFEQKFDRASTPQVRAARCLIEDSD